MSVKILIHIPKYQFEANCHGKENAAAIIINMAQAQAVQARDKDHIQPQKAVQRQNHLHKPRRLNTLVTIIFRYHGHSSEKTKKFRNSVSELKLHLVEIRRLELLTS